MIVKGRNRDTAWFSIVDDVCYMIAQHGTPGSMLNVNRNGQVDGWQLRSGWSHPTSMAKEGSERLWLPSSVLIDTRCSMTKGRSSERLLL